MEFVTVNGGQYLNGPWPAKCEMSEVSRKAIESIKLTPDGSLLRLACLNGTASYRGGLDDDGVWRGSLVNGQRDNSLEKAQEAVDEPIVLEPGITKTIDSAWAADPLEEAADPIDDGPDEAA